MFLKKSHNYYAQIQRQMMVVGLAECFFVIYTSKELKILKVDVDMPFIEGMFNKLNDFYDIYKHLLNLEVSELQ